MVLKNKAVNYFTCLLSFLLLIVIVLSKNIINNDSVFYGLIIISLLIIISCLLENSNINLSFLEGFQNIKNDLTRNCYERSKEHDSYQTKIDTRLDNLRDLEEKDRTDVLYEDEDIKLQELAQMNMDYLSNGETI
tara:strand:- start:508 stop:912 length:405 start_codon:yes stop_codon:yes gene_type:complete